MDKTLIVDTIYLRITTGSHYFCIDKIDVRARRVIADFSKKYIVFDYVRVDGQQIYTAVAVYGSATHTRDNYHFHIVQLNEFLERWRLAGFDLDKIMFVKKDEYKPTQIQFNMSDRIQAREYQTRMIEYSTNPTPNTRKLIRLQTGKGKSAVAMMVAKAIGYRTAIVVHPKYVQQWVNDLLRSTDLKADDILVPKSGKELMATLQKASNEGLKEKFIIISTRLLINWIKAWELNPDFVKELGWVCDPEDFLQSLGVGFMIRDEVHAEFHMGFRISTYVNVPWNLDLTATLTSSDQLAVKMMNMVYPVEERSPELDYTRYVNVKALHYSIRDMNGIRFKDAITKSYSHNLFERSMIQKSPKTFYRMQEMLNDAVDLYYYRYRKPGEKCLIYCASILMCTKLTDYFKVKYPSLKIGRFVEDDGIEVLTDSDIIVSTILSCGTGKDIAGLITVILQNSINSEVANLQSIGRLREIETPNPLTFVYYFCKDIAKQREYHEKKKLLLHRRAKSYVVENAGFDL